MTTPGETSEGRFIVLEGIDGAGTTTQCERYAAHLRAQRRPVHVTREPSSGPLGSMIRLVLTQRLALPATHHAETMALLFAADRLDHVASEIDPLLRDGYIVLSDRYDLSSLLYQSTTADERDASAMLAWIRDLNRHARRPDVTIVLDVQADIAAQRRIARGGKAEMYEDAEIQARLAASYRNAETAVPGDRLVHIDGNAAPDAVAAAIIAAVDPLIPARLPSR